MTTKLEEDYTVISKDLIVQTTEERTVPPEMKIIFIHDWFGAVIGGTEDDNIENAERILKDILAIPENKILQDTSDYIYMYRRVPKGYHF